MHRLPRAAASISVLMGLAAVLLAPGATLARAPLPPPHPSAGGRSPEAAELARHDPDAIRAGTTQEACTGWQSTYVPPRTIRVLRVRANPAKEHIDTVPFRQYVLGAMPHEWPEYMGLDALKIGALAVKQYGWYYTIVYRGGTWIDPNDTTQTPQCYDVVDTTTDQLYAPQPTNPYPYPTILQAVNSTWRMSLRKYNSLSSPPSSSFFLTGYRSGAQDMQCGEDADHYRLYQWSLMDCIHSGLDFEQSLRVYLDPRLEIVKPGAHNVIGTLQGDGTALALTGNGTFVPHIYAPTNATLTPTTDTGMTIQAQGLLGTGTADVNGDGFDDLLTMSSPGGSAVTINVANSDKEGGYGTATMWWRGDIGVPAGNALMLIGDFNADAVSDVGIVVDVPASTPPTSELLVLTGNLHGTSARKPVLWWKGSLNRAAKPRIFAGDVNGDGGADLLVMQPFTYPADAQTCGSVTAYPAGAGSRLVAMLSTRPANTLAPAKIWCDLPDVPFSASTATMGDFNRDAKDDLAVAYSPADGSTHIDVIRLARKHVKRFALWNRPSGYPATQLRLASADVDLDGISDLVLYRGLGKNGTQIVLLHADYTAFTATMAVTDSALDWKNARPF